MGLKGGWDFLTNMHIYMKQETSVVGTALCLPFCSTKECVRWHCISLNYLCEEASSSPCWLQQILFIHFTSGDNSSDMHKNYLFSVVHTSWPLCRITKFLWIGVVHIVNYAGQVHFFFFIWFLYVSCILNN